MRVAGPAAFDPATLSTHVLLSASSSWGVLSLCSLSKVTQRKDTISSDWWWYFGYSPSLFTAMETSSLPWYNALRYVLCFYVIFWVPR